MKVSLLKQGLALCCLAAIALFATPAASSIIRVKWDSPTDGPGNDWEHAFHKITDAVAAAQANDEVWVAGHSGHPYILGPAAPGAIILKDGLGLYGGFAGTEDVRDQRDWDANRTIVQGLFANAVIMAPTGTTVSTVIDGFTLKLGRYGVYCYASSSPTIANNTIDWMIDNGVYCASSSSPTITNNVITSSASGDGIYCASASQPLIQGNVLAHNNHGGIYCDHATPSVRGNTILGNSYGIRCHSSSPSIANNRITGNKDEGIYCDGSNSSVANNVISGNGLYGVHCYGSSPAILNNTISGGANYGVYCRNSSSPTLTNNIIASNSTGIYLDTTGSPVLRNNCVYNPNGTNYEGLAAGIDDICSDPKFVSTQYGRFNIQPDSLCIDAGLDSAVQPGWLDMDNQVRLQGAHVDIGADESDGTVWPEYQPVVVRVSTTGVDDAAHDGSSWALAKQTIQAGVDAASTAGGDVWVAAGTYAEAVVLEPFAYLYGGFSGEETIRTERRWDLSKSTIRGGGSMWPAVRIQGNEMSRLDGFTITNNGDGIFCGYSSSAIMNNAVLASGIGIDCRSASPLIANNVISGSIAAITCRKSAAVISNNTIAGNSGSGVACYPESPGIYSLEHPAVTNNILAFNGKGIYNDTYCSSPMLNNNCVYNPDGTNYSGLSPNPGDISVDPLFVSRATGDYHLKATSPCIDAGLNSAVLPEAVDMDGEPRIVPAAGTVDIGADEFTHSVADAKAAPDGHWVYLSSRSPVVTTAKFPDGQAYYVERFDRLGGIRCTGANLLNPGQSGVLQGIMGTDGGEKVITQASVVDGTLGTAEVPDPWRMICRTVGGASYRLQEGIVGGLGLNNIGLLIKTCGRVVEIETVTEPNLPTWFRINDGSPASVKVVVPNGVTIDPDWKYVAVTGISSCEKIGDDLYRLVRVRSSSDITPYLSLSSP